MGKYQNKYRIASARASWWNYGWNGAYFITICTQNREHFFGEIIKGKMVLSNLGAIADVLWYEIPKHSPVVELGNFVVMPNHIHGILILDKPMGNSSGQINECTNMAGGDVNAVETLHATSLRLHATSDQNAPPKNKSMSAISPKSDTVSTIIRSYKSAVTRHANRLELPNGWQARFYDHVIRDNDGYQRISDYIVNNPANWHDDKFSRKS